MKAMKEKQGFSLIELVIVIGIMAVVFGFMSLGLWYVFAEDAESVAHSINSGLTDLKSENTSKSAPTYLHLYMDDGTYYLIQTENVIYNPTTDGKGTKIGYDNVTVTIDTISNTATPVNADNVVTFGISKKDGAIKTWVRNKTDALGLPDDHKEDGVITTGLTKVKCNLNSDNYCVKVVQLTGKHFVRNE